MATILIVVMENLNKTIKYTIPNIFTKTNGCIRLETAAFSAIRSKCS